MNDKTRTLRSALSRFAADESGAVTVDWVVLTAAITGIGMLLFSILTPAVFQDGATAISDVVFWSIQR